MALAASGCLDARSGSLEVDLAARVVSKKNVGVKLTPTEYALLRFFVIYAGKALAHRQPLGEVRGPNASKETYYLRIHIAHLREKLEVGPARPELIRTEPSIGYRFLGA